MYSKLRMIMGSDSIVGYFLQALPIACIAGIVYLVLRLCRTKKSGAKINWPTELLRLVFVCYLTGLVSLIILPANFWLYVYDGIIFGWWDELGPVFQIGDVDLVPSVIGWLSGELSIGSWVKKMLIGNIAMFIPMGFSPRHKGKRPQIPPACKHFHAACLRGPAACFRQKLRH